MLYTGDNGLTFYDGVMMLGDREATQEEITAQTAKKTLADKKSQYSKEESDLFIVLPNTHKYVVSMSSLAKISATIDALMAGDTRTWYEEWGSFETNKLELQEVLMIGHKANQDLRDLIMGA